MKKVKCSFLQITYESESTMNGAYQVLWFERYTAWNNDFPKKLPIIVEKCQKVAKMAKICQKAFQHVVNIPLKALWMVQIKSFDLSATPPETMTSLCGGMPTVTCFCRTSKSVTAFDKSNTLLPRNPEKKEKYK